MLRAALAVLLVAGMLVTPLSLPPQPALAQDSMTDSKMAVVGLDGATLLDAPGGRGVAQLAPGDVLTAIGRTADSKHLQVETDQGANGWVTTASVVVFGVDVLPVVEAPAPATPTSAPTATPTKPAAPTAQPTPAVQPAATAAATATPSATEEADAAATTPAAAPGESAAATADAVIGVIVGEGAGLYDAPAGDVQEALPGAEAVTVIGRDADGAWLRVATLDGAEGWVKASELVVFGVEELPDMAGQTSVTKTTPATATAVVSATTTASATQTPTVAAGDAETETEAASAVVLPPAATTGVANVTNSRLNIRAGAGSTFSIVGKAGSGEELNIAARSEDSGWLLILRDDLPAGAGWVSASLVRLGDAASELPVSALEFDAAAAPTQAAPARPATTPEATATEAAAPEATEAAETSAASTAEASAAVTPARAPAAPARTGATGLSGTLAFQDGRGSIYAYDLARGEVRFLASGFDPAISDDGSKVAYLGIDGIRSINIDGSGDRLAFPSSDLITSPKWSPDGEWLVFSRTTGEYKCWQTEFMGCITLRYLRERFPFVPPGLLQKIFLSAYDRVAFPNFGLTRVNAQGEEFRDIAALDSAQAPDWNAAGIVYQSAAGIEVTQDTPDGETRSVQWGDWDWDPDWAPNGGPIVYQSKEGPHWEIFRINPDGSGVVALTRPVTTLVDELPSNVAPAFSPDGQQIVFLSNRRDDNDAGPWRLWVMNADGSNQRPLPLEIEIDYGFGGEQVVSWGL